MAPGTYLIKDFPHGPPFVIPTSNHFTDTAHVQDLVMEAFGLPEYQIYYLPAFALSREGYVYDVDATAKGEAVPTPDQFQRMLQALLAARFHLKTHWETKKISIYALVPDKGGPKFHEFRKDAQPPPREESRPFAGTTMFALARFITQNYDSPVLDGTGLPDRLYDFDINKLVNFHEIDREEGADPLDAEDYLRSALQHELGLKMESRKENMQILVVDHIDELSAN